MDFFWDLLLRIAAMGAGISFYSWLLSYDPGRQSDGSSSCYPGESPR